MLLSYEAFCDVCLWDVTMRTKFISLWYLRGKKVWNIISDCILERSVILPHFMVTPHPTVLICEFLTIGNQQKGRLVLYFKESSEPEVWLCAAVIDSCMSVRIHLHLRNVICVFEPQCPSVLQNETRYFGISDLKCWEKDFVTNVFS